MKPSQVLRTADFYKMWFMFALSAASGLMVIGHAANITKIQAHWEGGVIVVILLAIFNGIGRSFGGMLSDKIGRPALMRLTFVVQAINMFVFAFYTDHVILMIGVAIAGACYGACMVVFSAMTADLYGMKYFSSNYGLVFTSWGVAGVLGPIPGAMIFDATKSFNGAYLLAGAMAVVALIIALTVKGPKENSIGAQPLNLEMQRR
jgi:MFS family permease